MNAVQKVTRAIAPQIRSRTFVRATQPKMGGKQDPFEHPHLVWENMSGVTPAHFPKGKTAALLIGGVAFGYGIIMFSVHHQNTKHGFK